MARWFRPKSLYSIKIQVSGGSLIAVVVEHKMELCDKQVDYIAYLCVGLI